MVQRMTARIEPALKNIRESWQEVEARLTPFWSYMEGIGSLLASLPLDEISANAASFIRAFEQLPPKVQNAILSLAEHGWFIDVFDETFSLLFDLQKAIETKGIHEADRILEHFYEQKADEIEKYLVKRYRHRRDILGAAFEAHRNGLYVLSVLAFFSQVDGICWDMAESNFFVKRDGQPEIAGYIQSLPRGELTDSVLSALTSSLPISYSRSERGPEFSGLNRHMVVHGESVDYGTRQNSLKAMSLLLYTTKALEHVESLFLAETDG